MATSAVRELGVLGPTTVRADGLVVALRPRERDVLAALALSHPRAASVQELTRVLWPVVVPTTAKVTIQNHVARIRRALGTDAVLTEGGGYRLGPSWSLDVEEVDTRLERAHRRTLIGDHTAARVELEHARALGRGEAWADLDDGPAVTAARARRRELEAALGEELVLALLADGEHSMAVAEATALVSAAPGRELRWAGLALALYRSGRRRESIRVLGEGRLVLRDQAGLGPGPMLAQMEALVLDDDPSLLTHPPAALIGHRADSATRAADVFVGRAAELDEVRQNLLTAFAEGIAIVVIGPEGVGKSAFVDRVGVQAALDGWHVVAVTCPVTPTRPLEPLGEIVRQIVDREPNPEDVFSPRLLIDLARLWSDAGGAPRGDLSEAIVDTVLGHAERFPTLVVVDDAHHLPVTAAGLLRRLAAHPSPVAVLLAQPEAPEPDGVITTLHLQGLDVHDAGRFLELLTGETVSPSLATVVHGTTEGRPARLRQAARRTTLTGAAAPEDDDGGSILLDALQSTGPDAVAVAEVLVVAGAPLAPELIAAALSDVAPARVDEMLTRGVELGLLQRTGDDRLSPIDGRLEQALAGVLTPERRADRREQLGGALLDAGHLLAAAPHLLSVADRDPQRAIDVAEEAARTASDMTMFLEATAILEEATEVAHRHLGQRHHQQLHLRLAQADMLRRAGDPRSADIAWAVVRDAEAVGDADIVALGAAGLCGLGPLTEAGTLNLELADLVERAIAGCTTPAVRAACAGEATTFYSLTGRVERCAAHFEDALHNARLTGDDQVLLGVLGCVYPSLTHPDELSERVELAEELLTLAERVDDDEARFQALHLYFSNQLQRADPLLRSTLPRQAELASSLRTPGRRWMAGYQQACVAHLDGRLGDVMRISTDLVELAPVARSRAMISYWLNALVVDFARGDGESLAAEVDDIIEAQHGIPGWRGIAAWMAALRGDGERVRSACRELDQGRALPRDMICGAAKMLLGRAVAAHGESEDVAALTEQLAPFSGLMTWYGSGTVGPFDQALAELALATGDVEAARHHVAMTRRVLDRLQAVVYLDDLEAVARRLPA